MQSSDIRASTIAEQDRRFIAVLRRFNYIWLSITTALIIYSLYSVFDGHLKLFQSWRGPAILGLSIFIWALYAQRILISGKLNQEWPPKLWYAFSIWLLIYLSVIVLTFIDGGLVWDFWLVMGVGFSLFRLRYLVVTILIGMVTLLAFAGVFTWPPAGGDIGALVGTTVGVISMLISAMMIYMLIGERYARSDLIQELARAHDELTEAHKQLEASAVQEQELAVLRERTRLAREMHDTLGHALVLVSVKLEVIQRLRERDAERCDQELQTTKGIVRESMHELRASIANLRSPALEHEPACRALGRYAREMGQRASFNVTYDLGPDSEGLPDEVEETLWKVGQEALMNIEKHAQASAVILQMRRCPGYVLLHIEDNGRGLPDALGQLDDPEQASSEGHYGICGMVERAKQLGGRCDVRPGAERGTVVELELPLVQEPLG